MKCRGILLFALVVISFQSVGQQRSELEDAFQRSSLKGLRIFVNSYIVSDPVNPSDKIGKNVNRLLNTFISNYCADPDAVNSGAYKLPRWKQKQYIILQPEVNICFTDGKVLDSIYRFGKRGGFGFPVFRNKGNVYGNFPAGGYHIFKNLSDSHVQRYSLRNHSYKKYLPVIADTALIHKIDNFLHEDDKDYVRKVKFLTPLLALYPGAQVQQIREDGYLQMHFYYSLYIHRIVLDKKVESALIQYAFQSGSLEAYYQLKNNKWIEVESNFVREF